MACGRSFIFLGLLTDHLTHGRIVTKLLGIIGFLVTGQSAVQGLPELGHQTMPGIPYRTGVREKFGSHPCQANRLIQLPEREQTGIAGNMGSPELYLYRTVKTDRKRFP